MVWKNSVWGEKMVFIDEGIGCSRKNENVVFYKLQNIREMFIFELVTLNSIECDIQQYMDQQK